MRKFLYAFALLPSFACAMQLCTWCYETQIEDAIRKLEQSGNLIYGISCCNPDAAIEKRQWVIKYETPDDKEPVEEE